MYNLQGYFNGNNNKIDPYYYVGFDFSRSEF